MRVRKDVKNGDVVYRNKRGWYVPVREEDLNFLVGQYEIAVYNKKNIRSLTSQEWSELGFGVKPMTKEAGFAMGNSPMPDNTRQNTAIAIILAMLLAAMAVILLAIRGA